MREANALINQARQQIQSLDDFLELGQDSLPIILETTELIPVSSSRYQHYVIPFSEEDSRYLRPINTSLFVRDNADFDSHRNQFQDLIRELRNSRGNLESLSQELKGFADSDAIVKLL